MSDLLFQIDETPKKPEGKLPPITPPSPLPVGYNTDPKVWLNHKLAQLDPNSSTYEWSVIYWTSECKRKFYNESTN